MSDFKSLFKYYKSFKQSNGTELNEHAQGLIDLKCPNKFNDHIEKYELDLDYTAFDEINDLTLKRLLTNPRTWSPYSFKSLPGLIIISGILDGQQAINLYNLILHDLPFNNLSQLKSNIPLPPDDDVMMSNLRWITVGYHHNWNTKIYDADDKGEIPSLIYEMFTRLGQILRFDNFRPEAGIINYYTRKSVLSPHSDTSELNHDHPLFSLSLGCPSIFLGNKL